MLLCVCVISYFFFNDTPTTEIYTLSLHDALPISTSARVFTKASDWRTAAIRARSSPPGRRSNGSSGPRPSTSPSIAVLVARSEEHTSELQSQSNLVCRLLLEKKKKNRINTLIRSCCFVCV